MSVAEPTVVLRAAREAAVVPPTPTGVLADGAVRIEVTSVGLCGTDLAAWSAPGTRVGAGTVLGHEIGGRVVACASDVDGLARGDLVAVDPNISCTSCPSCANGRPARCAERRLMGVDLDGGLRATLDVDATRLVPVPDGDPEALALVEPYAVAVHALDRAGLGTPRPGVRIGVVGGGPIGVSVAVEARRRGVSALLLERDPVRRDAVLRLGLEAVGPDGWPTAGFEVVVDAVGSGTTAGLAVDAVSDGGIVCLVGLAGGEVDPLLLRTLVRREVTLVGTFCYTTHDLHRAARAVSEHGLDLLPVELVHGFARVPERLARIAAGDHGRGKTVVVPAAFDTPTPR